VDSACSSLNINAQVKSGMFFLPMCPYVQEEPITFSEETFITHRSSTMRQFLQNAIQLQFFKQVLHAFTYTRACNRHLLFSYKSNYEYCSIYSISLYVYLLYYKTTVVFVFSSKITKTEIKSY